MAEDQKNGANGGDEQPSKVTDLNWPDRFTPEVLNKLLAPFPLDEIEFRQIGKPNSKGNCLAFAYIDARAVMRRLDETVGPANWSFDYEVMSPDCGKVKGKLTLFGVTKCDAGEHEGGDRSQAEPLKSAVSDSLKRCAIQFGVGRFLYYLGDIYAPHNGKWFTDEPQIKPPALANACRIIGFVGAVKFPPRSVRRSLDDEGTSYTVPAGTQRREPPHSADERSEPNAPRTRQDDQGGREDAPPVNEAPPMRSEPPGEAPHAPAAAASPASAPSADGPKQPERSDGKLSQDQLRAVVKAVNDSGMGKEVRVAMQEKLALQKFNPTELPSMVTVGGQSIEVVAFVNEVVAEVKAARAGGA